MTIWVVRSALQSLTASSTASPETFVPERSKASHTAPAKPIIRSHLRAYDPSFSWNVTRDNATACSRRGILRSSSQKNRASASRARKTHSFPLRMAPFGSPSMSAIARKRFSRRPEDRRSEKDFW